MFVYLSSMQPSLSPRTVRALSVEADVAPDTVRRRLGGLPVRPSTGERIERAAQKLGVQLPPRAAAALPAAGPSKAA